MTGSDHQGGGGHHGRPMLVIVQNGDVEPSLEALFDFKTARSGNIFELDGGKGGRNGGHRFDNLIDIFGIQ